jgi:glycosyltransferase involved in cell wall biosynthesis
MVSRLAKDKHPDHAVEILNYLNLNSNIKYNLILMGDPDVSSKEYYLELLCKIQTYSLNDRVILTGWKEDVTSYLKQSQGLLILSDSESFGYSAVEAFSYGIPVFSYKISGGLHEFHKNKVTGVVVETRDPIELAKNIDFVFQNAKIWNELSDNSFRESKKFSIEIMIEQTELFYKEILNLS